MTNVVDPRPQVLAELERQLAPPRAALARTDDRRERRRIRRESSRPRRDAFTLLAGPVRW